MRVLVLTASRHGSTTEIGTTVADQLRLAGLSVLCRGVEAVGDADLVLADAVVLGSPAYGSRLLASGSAMADRLHHEFPGPVWLFAVGLEDLTRDVVSPAVTRPTTGGYRSGRYPVFGGVVRTDRLSPSERAMFGVMGGEARDLRDDDVVAAWAYEVARRLVASGQGSSSTLPVV